MCFGYSPINNLRTLLLLTALVLVHAANCLAAGSGPDAKTRALDLFIRGSVADVSEDYYRAVFHYQEALRYDSASAFIYVALAQDYLLLGNPTQAETLLDRALRKESNYVPALELKSLLERSAGKIPAARETLKKLVQIAPDRVDYLRQLLALELALENFDEAEKLYQRISTQNEDATLLSRQVLAVYLTSGEFSRAIRLMNSLLAADSSDDGLVFALGNAYIQIGDTIRGEELILRANRMNMEETRYWIARAAIELDRQNYTQVIRVVDSALVYTRPHASLFSLKGLSLYRAGLKVESVPVLWQAIDLDSTMFAAMGSLAMVYDELDSVDRAVELYERAIVLSDSAPVYLNNMAYMWAVRGMELERARNLAAIAVKKEPDNGAYLDTMGWIEFGLGNWDESLHWLKKAKDADPSNAATLEHMGDVHWRKGSQKTAMKYYRRALELDPSNETLRKKLSL